MSSGLYDPIVSRQEAEKLLVYSKKQAPRFHSIGKIAAMK
jgi:hypothetical protein